jgi:cephalosporin-C deacetylase-like acetyl esterase
MQNNSQADVELVKDIVDSIPVLKCFQKETRRKPLVILSHGFRGNKESWIPHLQTLAQHGYYAVALDNRSHGERREPDFVSQVFQGGNLKVYEVRRLIKETAEDISRLIDCLATATGVDQNRIGMAGVSMGGFTTFRALVIEKRIKVAAPIIGSPYWDDIPQGIPIADDPESQQALSSIAREFSPALSIVSRAICPSALVDPNWESRSTLQCGSSKRIRQTTGDSSLQSGWAQIEVDCS